MQTQVGADLRCGVTHLPLGDQQKHAFESYTPNDDEEHIAQCRGDTEDIQALKQGLLKLAVATCGRPGNHAADLRAQRNIQQREQRRQSDSLSYTRQHQGQHHQ